MVLRIVPGFLYVVLSISHHYVAPRGVQANVLKFASETRLAKQQYQKQQLRSLVQSTASAADEKTYLFAADGKKKPYSFIDNDGNLVGFDVDLVKEVCKVAKKKCDTILAEFTECIFTYKDIDYAGDGLMAQWFDGCPGYQITIDRLNEFDFTLPYLTSSASFTVAPGNPSKFTPDSTDYSKFKIVHLTGAPTNSHCLTRLNKTFNQDSVIVARDLPEAKELILNRTADVLFSPRNAIPDLEVLPERLHCETGGGAGILLKKGSDLSTWWNPAFRKYYMSGDYEALCEQSEERYGAAAKCLPPPNEAEAKLLAILDGHDAPQPTRLWNFVVSGAIKPYSFLNTQGELVGFTKDMVQEVCRRAGKSCVLTLAKVSECTKRVGELLYPQRGLMEGWFDACTGYYDTDDRRNSWDFTSPYLVSNATFKVLPGNPKRFDPSADDYSNFVLVREATSITTDHCLNRLHKKFDQLLVAETQDEAVQTVLNGTADAWFTKVVSVPELETMGVALHCEHVGTSVMVRKGSDVPSWWNPAFHDFYQSGDFNRFCVEQEKKYNFNFPCLPPPPSQDVTRAIQKTEAHDNIAPPEKSSNLP